MPDTYTIEGFYDGDKGWAVLVLHSDGTVTWEWERVNDDDD